MHRGNLNDLIKNIENKKVSNKTPPQQTLKSPSNPMVAGNVVQQRNGGTGNKHFAMKTSIENDKEDIVKTSETEKTEEDHVVSVGFTKSELLRKFDNKYKTDSEKDCKETELSRRFSRESPADESTGSSEDASIATAGDLSSPSQHQQQHREREGSSGSVGSGVTSPPRPMPRTSRNNSLGDAATTAAVTGGVAGDEVTPRPRPRTTAAAAYKVCRSFW